MKKIILLSIILVLLTGCTNIEKTNLDNIINEAVSTKVKTTNNNRLGYKYYLPLGITNKERGNFSEVLKSEKYLYYLYVDIISFLHNPSFNYSINTNAYYSKSINYNGKTGYVEINNYANNQYLVEIMYNYAKIEVVVYARDINKCIAYSMSILSSVDYDTNVIKTYLEDSKLDGVEEKFDIFEIVGRDNYLGFSEEETKEDSIKDPDYIR